VVSWRLGAPGLLAMLACLPSPRGQCRVDADCAGGPAGLFCADAVCQAGPLAVLEDVPRAVFSRSQLAAVRVRVLRTRGTPVLALSFSGQLLSPALEADGRFRFDVPLRFAPAGTEASVPFSVSVVDDLGHPLLLTDALEVDDLPPRISVDPASVPASPVLRGTQVVLRVTLTDRSPSTLSYQAGTAGDAVAAQADGIFSLPIDTSAAAPAASSLAVVLTATDALNNAASTTVQLALTRLKWKAQDTPTAAIIGIALSNGSVIVTQAAASALLLSRQDGAILMRPSVGAIPLGNVATDGTYFYVAGTDEHVCKIGLDGTTRWCCGPFGLLVGGVAVGPLPAPQGSVAVSAIVATGNVATNDGKRLYLLRDASDGSCDPHSSNQVANFQSATPSIGSDGTIYAGAVRAVVAAQFDGNSWGIPLVTPETTDYLGQPALRAPTATGQSVLFSSKEGFLNLLAYASAPLSVPPSGSRVQASGSSLDAATSATLAADGTAVVGTQDAQVVAIAPDGSVRWRIALPSPPTAAPTQGAGGVVYVGTQDGTLFALALTDGRVLWSFAAGSALRTPPALGCDGALYVGSDNGAVFALATDSKGLAHSPWPREGHDSRGTGDARRPLNSADGGCQE